MTGGMLTWVLIIKLSSYGAAVVVAGYGSMAGCAAAARAVVESRIVPYANYVACIPGPVEQAR